MDEKRMKEFCKSHFHTGHYKETNECMKSSLRKIEFDNCYIVLRNEEADNCPYSDAYDFLHGTCHLFARALHERFGYEVYEIKNKKAIHWFGKSIYKGETLYIDVRGATTDFNEFLSEFKDLQGDDRSITPHKIEEQTFYEDWDETGLLFAHAVINKNPEYYEF